MKQITLEPVLMNQSNGAYLNPSFSVKAVNIPQEVKLRKVLTTPSKKATTN
jgi:hypothetical protein